MFLVSYAAFIYLSSVKNIESVINNIFRQSVELSVKGALPDAYIQTQEFKDANQNLDPNIFYLVYGNPKVIQAEQEFANKQGLKQYKISSYSFQLYIFQMFTVPFGFLLAIFLATPMFWKTKMISLGISWFLLIILLMIKCILISLFSISNQKIGIYSLDETQANVVFKMVNALNLGFTIFFSFCLWLIFGFRNSLFNEQFSQFIKIYKK